MNFEFLGRVKAYPDNNGEETILPRQLKLLLVVLVLAEGPITKERLYGLLWEGEAEDRKPKDPRDRLFHLKKDLDAALTNPEPGFPGIQSRDGCYQIVADRKRVDVFRFRDGVKAARRALAEKDDAGAVSLWRAAIAEWGPYRPGLGLHGPEPLAGLTGMRAELFRDSLQAEYRSALTDCLAAELRLGRHAEVIPELNELFNADDAGAQDETLARLLMLACYRSRQREAALKTFRRLRGQLKEIGVSPSKELERLHSQILNNDPALDLQDGATMSPADASLGEFPATDDMSAGTGEIPAHDEDPAEPATADVRKRDARRPRGQLFGHVIQLGENPKNYQAETQIFHEHSEGS